LRRLQSRDNPEFKRIARLASSARERRSQLRILLDGPHLIDAYLRVFGPQHVLIVVREDAPGRAEIDALCKRVGHDQALLMAERLFDALSPVDTPTGVMAVAPLPGARAVSPDGLTLLVDGIQDPGNLGSILRSAAAAGCSTALLSPACTDPWSPRCLRGGMGAQFLLAIHDRHPLLDAAQSFAGQVVAASAAGEASLYETALERRCAIVIGAEGRGISPELMACAGVRVRIPMGEGIESLNAAAAATLLCYEWARRHRPA